MIYGIKKILKFSQMRKNPLISTSFVLPFHVINVDVVIIDKGKSDSFPQRFFPRLWDNSARKKSGPFFIKGGHYWQWQKEEILQLRVLVTS